MLIEEFEVFKTIANNLSNLETWHGRNVQNQTKNKAQIQKILESPSATYGFFKKVTKEEKLVELRRLDTNYLIETGIGAELLSLIYQIVQTHEIPLLKLSKKARFDKIVYEFSQSRIQELEKELLLWQTVNLPDEDKQETDKDNKKIEQQDFRFTELPRMREVK